MIQILKMAFRDLGRNRRRSILSALALGIGLSLLLLMAGVVQGEMGSAMDSTIKLQSGHLQVRALTYSEDISSLAWEDLIQDPGKIAAQIAALAPVKAATPRLFASGIVAASDESIGVRIIGIDPPSAANAPFRDGLLSGAFLQADDRDGVFIGQPLADKINAKVGDTINLSVNTANGDVADQVFTIRGTYSTQTYGFDQGTVFLPLAKAQAITGTENHASTIFVLLNDRNQTAAVTAALQTSQYQVKTWEQLNELLVTYDKFASSYMVFLYLIVLAVTATVIVNTLVMSVFERTREIGILSAIGMKSGRIMSMFFAESAFLGLGGILLGLVMGVLMVTYFNRYGFYIGNFGITGMLLNDRIYASLKLADAVNLTVTAFIIALLAAIYPAILAARLEPVEALHGGK